MTREEAIESVMARAPSADELLAGVVLPQPQYRQEEIVYQLVKWIRKNATPEEIDALGLLT